MLDNFICATKDYNTLNNFVPAPYLRKNFYLNKPISSAKIVIAAFGFYKLFVNGKNITKGLLAPYRSNPNHIVYYDEYDLSSIVLSKNTIAILLGNGIQNSVVKVWGGDSYSWRSAPKVAFEIEIQYADGEKQTLLSDTTVKVQKSPIIFDDLHFGEYYDSRFEIDNWNAVEFNDGDWFYAMKAESPVGERKKCTAQPIVVRERRKPIDILPYKDGYVYDFKYNDAGLVELHIDGYAGQKITLKYFETFVNGEPYFENIRFSPKDDFQVDMYICSGKGKEAYIPSFTYHGFRYVYVEGITKEQADCELLTYVAMSSDIKTNGSFVCDNYVVNKIQEATCRSDLANFYYFPTDCPQREKNGWTADISLSAEQMLINLFPEDSFACWLDNVYLAMTDEGKLPGIIPTEKWGYSWGNGPAWDGVLINLPYYIYKYRNEISVLKSAANSIKRYLEYIKSRLNDDGLIAIGLGDWCQPARPEDKYDTPLVVTDSILSADIAKKSSQIFKVLGLNEYQCFADGLYNQLMSAIKSKLVDHENCLCFGNTQTSQAMALFYDIFSAEEKETAVNNLVEIIHKNGDFMNTGVLGGKVIFRVLADNGYENLAFKMITREEFPSYGNWISRGATTLWEGFWKDGEGKVLSMNHHFWGDVSAWFYSYLAGIKINPEFYDLCKINIKPCFVEAINKVEASYQHKNGLLKCSWSRNENGIVLDLLIPENTYGEVLLPKEYKFSDGTKSKKLQTGTFDIVNV